MTLDDQTLIAQQLQFSRAIRGAAGDDLPSNVSDEQLAIYRELFWETFESCLSAACPVASAVLADDWFSVVRQFWCEHAAVTPEYPLLPFEFGEWISARHAEESISTPPWIPQLITWELAELAALYADDDSLARAAPGDAAILDVPLWTSQSLQLFGFEWPVHRISPSWQPDAPETVFLACYRNPDDDVEFLELTPMAAALLEQISIAPGEYLSDYLGGLFQNTDVDDDALKAGISAFAEDACRRGILLVLKTE